MVRTLKANMLNGGRSSAEDARISVYAGLVSIAKERGYKRGWILHKFRALFGHWPQIDPPGANPSGELLWWIRKEARAYRRMKEAAEIRVKPSERESELMRADDWKVNL